MLNLQRTLFTSSFSAGMKPADSHVAVADGNARFGTSRRAKFSLEASSGAMDEALVDIRGCDFHGEDLSAKV